MPVLLALPVAALVAGAATGLRLPQVPAPLFVSALLSWAWLAVRARRDHRAVLLAVAAAGAFAVGGVALANHAWQRAWRSPLRIAFESIEREDRRDARLAGRQVPVDGSARVVLEGTLRSDAALTARGAVSMDVRVEWIGRLRSASRVDPAMNPAAGGVLLTVQGVMAPAQLQQWRAGRKIRAFAELRRIARYLDPGVPDQERQMARRGVSLAGSVKSAALVEITARGSRRDEAAASLRAFSRRAIAAGVAGWSPRASAIVSAIVIGDRSGLAPDVERRLQESGTYHVIAISGGNIAILAGILLAAFRMAGLLGRVAMLCAAAVLIGYGEVVTGGASVDRAVLMAAVYFAGRGWDLRSSPFQLLVLAAGIAVLADPLAVADPATLLTFGATGAIVAVAPLVEARHVPRLVAPAATLFAASAAAETTLLPVSAALFQRVTCAGLVLNFGAIPLMAVAQLAGMAVVPLYLVSEPACRAAGWLAFAGAEGLVRTAALVDVAPWAAWRVPAPPGVVIGAYYMALGAWWWGRARAAPGARASPGGAGGPVTAVTVVTRVATVTVVTRVAAVTALLAGAWIAAPAAVHPTFRSDERLRVTFVDVGQGDAALVRFPKGSTMLVDAGGLPGGSTFDVGDRVVGATLRALGVRRLSTLVTTHGDADHAAGAAAVVREFRPWDIWEGVPVPAAPLTQALRSEARLAGSRWTTVQRHDRTEIDGVEVAVLHPALPDWERQRVRNDDSVVLQLRLRDVSFVLTGDIGAEAEATLDERLGQGRIRVLKVPHHGSASSSSERFVRLTAPSVAIVSAGRANTFGHPARIVLQRYEEAGTAVFRTDVDGAITVSTDGRSLEVQTFSGRRLTLRSDAARTGPPARPWPRGATAP